ncbi:MAG TPA: WbqC family protein [Candidatus Saccharimonadales bacterium]|nr:WbqC family protein [Candidatus Saccharimonadales bacterium]
MKKTAIMQPYFLPYIGYWQLIHAVDEFVVYDNIEYTKKGWFNRNRILDGDHDRPFTIPLKKDSDFLNVNQRFLSDDSAKEIARLLRIIQSTYRKAPCYAAAYPVIEACFLYDNKNLFEYNYHAIQRVCEYLGITTKLTISSCVAIDHSLKAEQKVLAICKATHADMYINSIGGTELYDTAKFAANGLELRFIKALPVEYAQFGNPFVPWLSIIDVLMCNNTNALQRLLEAYELL